MDVPGAARVNVPGSLPIIAPASAARLVEINDVVARAKAFWPWPERYLSAALPLLKVSGEYLELNPSVVAIEADGAISAFGSLAPADGRTYVDHLWVRPDRIGQGVGRHVCGWLLACARERDVEDVWVLPDPPAEGFYREQGFVDTGERVPSRVPGGPVFSLLGIGL
jgi:GNAT superfamily N-acetyltransferase